MPLLERDGFLDELMAVRTRAASGPGCLVAVCGEAGVGKSSLMRAFAERVHDAGREARVLWGACDALYTPRPLGPLVDMARAAGVLRSALEEGASRERLFGSFLDELGRLPGTVAIFEDVHWADDATLDLLKFVGRRLRSVCALVVVTHRDDELPARHPLRLLFADLPRESLRRICLPRLSPGAVEVMARGAGRPGAGIYEATGGNPFYVTEALAAGPGEVPPSVRDAVFARAARLAPSALLVLDAVALVSRRAERALIEAVVRPAAEDVEGCIAAGMLESSSGHLSFRHELARRAWEDSVEAGRAVGLHAQLLAALQEGFTAPEMARLVHHASRARDRDAVLRFAPAAAVEAARLGAHRGAASHYETALGHADALPPRERARLLDDAAYEQYLTGEIDGAVAARLEALGLWESLGERGRAGVELRWLSRLSWVRGDRAEAMRYALAAIEVLEPLGPGPALAMALSNRAQLHMLAEEPDEAVAWGTCAINMAEAVGDVETLAHALNNVGSARADGRTNPEGYALLERSLALALQHGLHEHVARAYTNLGTAAAVCRDYEYARRYLDDGIAYSVERDLDSWTWYLLGWRARIRLELGQWKAAEEDAAAVLHRPGCTAVLRLPALLVLGLLRLRRGDPGARELLDEAGAHAAGTQEIQRIGPVAAAHAEAAWLAGRDEDTARAVLPAYELARAHPHPWELGLLASWLGRAGGLEARPHDVAEPYGLELQGDWLGAAAAWAALGCPYERALALGESDDPDALHEALEILRALGACPAAERLERTARALGVRRLPRGPRPSTRGNPAQLTARQLRIVPLLAEGLSNAEIARRLFISHRTVDHHVSAILGKLGARTRHEAAARARQLRILSPG